MNKEQQRIRIAESQGWKHDICNVGKHGTKMSGWWMPCGAFTTDINMLPDYCNDLNAMHEAEKVLTEDQLSVYGAFLKGKDNETVSLYAPEHREIAKVAMASAAQRAEAFLRTIGKWTTNPNEL